MRDYLGVDWADQTHAVWVVDEPGTKVASRAVPHTAAGWSEWGRERDEWQGQGIELWAAIERPEGRVVDFLLEHGGVVYPVNPKALDRARDRFRSSAAKSDPFDARVLAEFLGTDHRHLQALQPSSETAQELQYLTADYRRHVRQPTRCSRRSFMWRGHSLLETTSPSARDGQAGEGSPDAHPAV
jgi:hypothetical protein